MSLKSIAQVSEGFIGYFNVGSQVHAANLCISLPRHFVLIIIVIQTSCCASFLCDFHLSTNSIKFVVPVLGNLHESKDHQDAHREVLDNAWCGLFAAARRLRVRACGLWTVYPRLQCTKVEAHCRRTGSVK